MLLFRPIFTSILVSCSTFHYHHLKKVLNRPCKGLPETLFFREMSHNTGIGVFLNSHFSFVTDSHDFEQIMQISVLSLS